MNNSRGEYVILSHGGFANGAKKLVFNNYGGQIADNEMLRAQSSPQHDILSGC